MSCVCSLRLILVVECESENSRLRGFLALVGEVVRRQVHGATVMVVVATVHLHHLVVAAVVALAQQLLQTDDGREEESERTDGQRLHCQQTQGAECHRLHHTGHHHSHHHGAAVLLLAAAETTLTSCNTIELVKIAPWCILNY